MQRRLVVGLTGYPNVGKSSTINALFGEEQHPSDVPARPYLCKRAYTALLICLLCNLHAEQ